MQTWTPAELQTYLQHPDKPVQILDVREQWEYDIAHLPGSVLIPLGRLTRQWSALEPDVPVLVVCHHGIRSAQACYYLEHNGLQAINLHGGLDRWAREIDFDMPLY